VPISGVVYRRFQLSGAGLAMDDAFVYPVSWSYVGGLRVCDLPGSLEVAEAPQLLHSFVGDSYSAGSLLGFGQ